MRSIILSAIMLASAYIADAQTNFSEIEAAPDKTFGLYYPYPVSESVNTKAPKGFKPFYISHYGRHGSRYLINESDYTNPLKVILLAEDDSVLTDLGHEVKRRLEVITADAMGRTGELTQIGVKQHHDIAQRMYKAFPEVFKGSPEISAISTTRMRCALSMAAFCEGLKEINPKLDIKRESAQRYMAYMANSTPQAHEFNRSVAQSVASFNSAMSDADRLVSSLFNDSNFIARHQIDDKAFMRQLFLVAIDMPNTECDERLDDIFTTEELFNQWRAMNYRYYNEMSNPTSANGAVLDNARPLLANIVSSADKAIAGKVNGADLRFGHDSCIVPLLGLIKAEGCYGSTDDPEALHEVYADFKVSPMATNLQIIFFKDKKDNVIAKLMLNEREISLPIESFTGPYYRWADLRNYFNSILSQKRQ